MSTDMSISPLKPRHAIIMLGLLSFSALSVFAEKAIHPAANAELFAQLLEERDPEKFPFLLEKSIEQGLPAQNIIEAEMLYQIDQADDQALIDLLPRILESRKNNPLEGSQIFSTNKDWDATIEFVRAIKASKENDTAAFEKHIKEAFWLNPQQAPILTPYIQKLHTSSAMKSVTFDFSNKLPSFSGKNEIALTTLLGDKDALLIHFWSPWSMNSDRALPDYGKTAQALRTAPIALCSVLPDDLGEDSEDVLAMLKENEVFQASPWLLDRGDTISQQFLIRTVPTMILIDRDGTIIYNGSPSDRNFWNALKKIDKEIQRP